MNSYCDIDFANRKKKRWIQTFFYSTSKVHQANVLILCGPDLNSHVADFKLISGVHRDLSLTIYETDRKTYLKNVRDSKKYPTININIINDDIINAKVTRFVDLDFCCSLYTSFPIVEKIYNSMKNKCGTAKKTLNKHILITFCVRDGNIGTKLKDSINDLCNLFGISNKFKPLDLLPKTNIMKHVSKDCMFSTYKDGTPMCTFSYQFK